MIHIRNGLFQQMQCDEVQIDIDPSGFSLTYFMIAKAFGRPKAQHLSRSTSQCVQSMMFNPLVSALMLNSDQPYKERNVEKSRLMPWSKCLKTSGMRKFEYNQQMIFALQRSMTVA